MQGRISSDVFNADIEVVQELENIIQTTSPNAFIDAVENGYVIYNLDEMVVRLEQEHIKYVHLGRCIQRMIKDGRIIATKPFRLTCGDADRMKVTLF